MIIESMCGERTLDTDLPYMLKFLWGQYFTDWLQKLVSAEEYRQIAEYSRSGNTKSKGVAKVPLKRPVQADLGNASLPENCQELAVAHSA